MKSATVHKMRQDRSKKQMINSKQLDFITPILFGASSFQYLNAACELGLFDLLHKHNGLNKNDIAEALQLEERALNILLLGVTALNLIIKTNNFYFNHAVIDQLINENSWLHFKNIVAFEQYIVYAAQIDFTESLRANRNIGLRRFPGEGRDLYHRLSHNAKLQQVFYDYMDSWTKITNSVLIDKIDFHNHKKLLDVGGGTAINSIAIAKNYENLQIDVLEIPDSKEVAEKFIQQAGLSDRITVYGGDMFRDDFPKGCDCILFSHQLVIWTPEENQKLLEKAYEALGNNGKLIIFSSISNDNGDGPLMAALDSVYFASLPAEGGMIYSWYEYENWLKNLGFKDICRYETSIWTPHGIITAIK